MSKQVHVEDRCDGFSISIYDNNAKTKEYFYFDQEDSREQLVDVFKHLGYDATYEEVY